MIHSNIYRFRDKRQFRSKIAEKLSHPGEFNANAKEFCNGSRVQKNYGDAPTRRWKNLTLCALLLDTMPQCDGLTDRNGKIISRCACYACSRTVIKMKEQFQMNISLTAFV